MLEDKMTIALESISAKGCDYCLDALQKITDNNLPIELTGCSTDEVQAVYQELSSIMTIYKGAGHFKVDS